MKDNCVEPTLSLSLVKETSTFHGQEWWQGHGPGLTQAPVGPGWRWFPHSFQCRSRRGFPTWSPMILHSSQHSEGSQYGFLMKIHFCLINPKLLPLLATKKRNDDTASILPFATVPCTWQPLYLERLVCL